MKSALGRCGSGHSSLGFIIINVSATLGGMGSVATSAVPILVKTLDTSGMGRMADSNCSCISTAWLRLVPGILRAWTAMSPSSKLGKNSAPIFVVCIAVIITRPIANTTTGTLFANAHFNTGSYSFFSPLIKMFSLSATFPLTNNATAAGTTVMDSISAESNAVTTVKAMG